MLALLAALVPVVWTLQFAAAGARNVPYFDEIDTAIELLLRLEAGVGPTELLRQLVAVNTEHRMVTSRLLFVVSYALTGSVNFNWVGAIGIGFIVIAAGLLVASVSGAAARLRLGVVLGFLLFHLGHYENYLWSGASIDHFQVLALAAGAIAGLQTGRRWGVLLGILAAVLATFTLAQGATLWPVGLLFLLRDGRRRTALGWTLAGAATMAVFLAGFHFNPGHRVGGASLASAGTVASYWLQLLGAPLSFGHGPAARLLGALLLGVVLVRSWRGPWSETRTSLPVLWFIAGSTLLIAIGRAEMSGSAVASRYLVLGALGWSVVIADLLGHARLAARPALALGCAVPLLAALNLGHNVRYRGDAFTFLEHRDRAALRFRQHGEDGRAPARLHPLPRHSTHVLREAERRGVYRIPPVCEARKFPRAVPDDRIICHLDECTVEPGALVVAGWAAVPERALRRGEIHLALRSNRDFLVFTTVALRRPDVVQAHDNPDWEFAGFRAAIRHERLPPGRYEVGVLLAGDAPPAFVFTGQWLEAGTARRTTAAVTSSL